MLKSNRKGLTKFHWKGYTLQLFLITIFPVALILIYVAFGSQSLHRHAMRNLVVDRDLRTVQVAAASIEQQISELTRMIEILSHDPNIITDFSALVLNPHELTSIMDGGIALYTLDGKLIQSLDAGINWKTPSAEVKTFLNELNDTDGEIVLSLQPLIENGTNHYVFVGKTLDAENILVGAFSTDQLIQKTVGRLAHAEHTMIMVVGPGDGEDSFELIYQNNNLNTGKERFDHPGIRESLTGNSGTDFFQTENGEHVVAFSPIDSLGWGLISEEVWENITSPSLNTTQYAPLIIVPVFLLSLLVIWFGASRIVSPLQKLEQQAAQLAEGDFEAIQKPVGGIEEIQTVQSELIEMAQKLKNAQQNLRGYIGAMTEGIENERRSLAREIHDDTIQSLIALNQRIQILMMKTDESQKDDLQELLRLMKQTMENLRRMIRGLRPIYLEDLGLATSLDMLVREMEQSAHIPIQFSVNGEERRFAPQIELSFYRMAQESLNNILRHAQAKQSWVRLDFEETGLTLQIRDDGKGFVVPINAAEFPKQGHFGLLGLKERAELIHAELEITSKVGEGTLIFIRLSGVNT